MTTVAAGVAQGRTQLGAKQLVGWGIGLALAAVIGFWLFSDSSRAQAVLGRVVREASPLLLGAMGGLIGERSGVVNIGIEGQMLMAAFTGFVSASMTGSLLVGMVIGMVTGAVVGLFLGLCAVTLKIDQIIAGTVINIMALGFTSFFYDQERVSAGSIGRTKIPGLSELPIVGRAFFSSPLTTYLAFLLVPLLWVALYRTPWGLRIRAVGEHPSAADTVGISVERTRYVAVMVGGALAGMGGASLSLVLGSFERNMSAGRGFLALAIMIFGRWNPLGALAGAALFGFLIGGVAQLQIEQSLSVPASFVNMVPYALTIVVLAGFGGRARPPAASGKPYLKE